MQGLTERTRDEVVSADALGGERARRDAPAPQRPALAWGRVCYRVPMSAVAFYISGHGLGHAARQIAVINALGELRPEVRIEVRSSAPAWLFEREMRPPGRLTVVECDTGAVQRGSLGQDALETLRAAATFQASLAGLAEAEAQALTAQHARLIVGDIPPLAFAAAARAGVAAVALANFTWDWIYEEYAQDFPEYAELPDTLGEIYASAAAAWRLPMAGGFDRFPLVVDLPWVARRSAYDRAELRERLRLPNDRPLVLIYLGHYGVAAIELAHHERAPYSLVTAEHSGVPRLGAGHVHVVDEAHLRGSGLAYHDLVRAADIVLTKPGYGIIASSVANDTAVLYTDRGQFREYGLLVHHMPRVLRCAYLDHDALISRRWDTEIARLLDQPPPPERPLINGAEVAAGMISTFL